MPEGQRDDNREQTADHDSSIDQHKDEPLRASHDADDEQPAAAAGPDRGASQPAGPAGPGQAVRDMMGGPTPQGDVPDAPATQIAAADNEEGTGPRVRHVANAVPGKPDGEVDTRS